MNTDIADRIAKLRAFAEDLKCPLPGYGLALIKLADNLEEELRREVAA